MAIEKAIVSLITARRPYLAGKIKPAVSAKKLSRPNIVYQLITARNTYSNDGPTGLKFGQLQLSCYADNYELAKTMAEGLTRPANAEASPGLDGYSGTIDGVTLRLLIDDERDAPEAPTPGQDTGVAGVIITLSIAYSG